MKGKFSLESYRRDMETMEPELQNNSKLQKNESSYKKLKERDENSPSASTSQKVFSIKDDENQEDDVFEDYQSNSIMRPQPHSPRFDEHTSTDPYSEMLRPPSQRGRIISASISSRNRNSPKKSYSSGDLQGFHARNAKRNLSNKESKNDDMVLQLVIPSNNPGNSNNNNMSNVNPETNTLTMPPTVQDILAQNQLRDRMASKTNSYSSNADLFTLGYSNAPPYSRTQSYVDFGEFTRSNSNNNFGLQRVASIDRLTPALSTKSAKSDIYLPTPPEQKKKAFSDLLSKVLSVMYALLIITFGLTFYVNDVLNDGKDDNEKQLVSLAEFYSLFMVISSFLYVLYLTIDISVYMRRKAAYEELLDKNTPDDIEIKETADGNYELNIKLPEMVKQMGKTLEHHYCFNKDRHSANFYLKVGAMGFCFGHLIHCGLLLGYRFVFMAGDKIDEDCISIPTIILEFIYPIYSFLLLFFIFKYSNVIINRHVVLARFGIMHCFSASLCFWMWTIFRETLEYIANNKKDYDVDAFNSTAKIEIDNSSPLAIQPFRFTKICDGDNHLRVIYQNYSPYLYPFSVEYSILVVGVLFIMWQNIALCHQHFSHDDNHHDTKECANPKSEEPESNIAIHVDCHAANKGLFGGIIVFVFSVISIILFFIAIYSDDENFKEYGFLVNTISSLVLVAIMLPLCVIAYRQITQLDINLAAHNQLDNILLLICIPAFFFNGIFSILPAILYKNALAASAICVETLQVVIQTVFIMDGMQRCSNTKQLRQKKPGRELVTFLLMCNVAMWVMQTFEVKSHGLHDYRYEFYTKELWSIIGHMCLPLIMFYRFHSSVCLGDIWKYGYDPAGH